MVDSADPASDVAEPDEGRQIAPLEGEDARSDAIRLEDADPTFQGEDGEGPIAALWLTEETPGGSEEVVGGSEELAGGSEEEEVAGESGELPGGPEDVAGESEELDGVSEELVGESEEVGESEGDEGDEEGDEGDEGDEEDEEDEEDPRAVVRASARVIKEALAAQAEVVALTWPGGKARPEMARLMERWKQAGHATKAEDNALWLRFKSAQDMLFTRLDLEREGRKTGEGAARAVKEGLVATAESLAERADTRQAAEAMRSLMAQWKQAGDSGRGDQELWRRFKAAQDKLYSVIKAKRKSSDATYKQVAATKRAAVDDVTALIGSPDRSQARAEMKRLGDLFHAAGYAGRENRQLLEDFKKAQEEFWTWVRGGAERRQATGLEGAPGRRTRLTQQVAALRRDIAQAEEALSLVADEPGAPKRRGPGVTLSLTADGRRKVLAAELMRLRLRLVEAEEQLYRLDRVAARPDSPAERPEEDAAGPDSPAERPEEGAAGPDGPADGPDPDAAQS